MSRQSTSPPMAWVQGFKGSSKMLKKYKELKVLNSPTSSV